MITNKKISQLPAYTNPVLPTGDIPISIAGTTYKIDPSIIANSVTQTPRPTSFESTSRDLIAPDKSKELIVNFSDVVFTLQPDVYVGFEEIIINNPSNNMGTAIQVSATPSDFDQISILYNNDLYGIYEASRVIPIPPCSIARLKRVSNVSGSNQFILSVVEGKQEISCKMSVTQTGSLDPSDVKRSNNTGRTFDWARLINGAYSLTISGSTIPLANIDVIIGGGVGQNDRINSYSPQDSDPNFLIFNSFSVLAGANADDGFNNTYVEIIINP